MSQALKTPTDDIKSGKIEEGPRGQKNEDLGLRQLFGGGHESEGVCLCKRP